MKNKKQTSSKASEPKPDPEATESEFSYNPDEPSTAGGESVKVALRLRPMNNAEVSRGDTHCFKIIDRQNCQLLQK